MNRRKFTLNSVYSFLGLLIVNPIVNGLAWAEEKCSDLIDMSKKKRTDKSNNQAVGIATGFGYVEDIDQSMKSGKNIKRKTKNANCANCAQYEARGQSKCGICKIIPVSGVTVHENGYCNIWTPKS